MKNRDFQMELQKTLSLLSENPFNPKLKTNKLKGILEGLYACRINYDFRIIFNLIVEVNKTSILLVDIGTHDEVY
jgi:mRNA-degrading endonuclease YafQ of YafQ-DinJ toxin-antitoxin module